MPTGKEKWTFHRNLPSKCYICETAGNAAVFTQTSRFVPCSCVCNRQWACFKTSTRSGVRTHADICPLELKSNALTTRPSWCAARADQMFHSSKHALMQPVSRMSSLMYSVFTNNKYHSGNQKYPETIFTRERVVTSTPFTPFKPFIHMLRL